MLDNSGTDVVHDEELADEALDRTAVRGKSKCLFCLGPYCGTLGRSVDG